MKSKLIRKMHIILVLSVIAIATGMYLIFFIMSYNNTINEIRERARGATEYIMDSLEFEDFANLSLSDERGVAAREKAQERLNILLYVGDFKHLYIAVRDENGDIITTLNKQNPEGTYSPYVPTGRLYADLRESLSEGTTVTGRMMYLTDYGRVFSVFWAVLDEYGVPVATVGMEFDVDSTYSFFIRMAVLSLILAVVLIIIISIISYLSMHKTNEPGYKKMANLDFLTGLQNRLAYEQRLVACEQLISEGSGITIVIFDINDLKHINDTMGHNHGDNYIINTATIITELVGELGDLYRIGDDEFAAIIVDGSQKDIDDLLDSLSKKKRHVLNKQPLNCAFGAATFTPGVDKSLNDLAKRAEEEMHSDKTLRR